MTSRSSTITITNAAGRNVTVATHTGASTGGRFAHTGGQHSSLMAAAHITTAAGGTVVAAGVAHGGGSSAHGGGHAR
jgi:hypothetical protein